MLPALLTLLTAASPCPFVGTSGNCSWQRCGGWCAKSWTPPPTAAPTFFIVAPLEFDGSENCTGYAATCDALGTITCACADEDFGIPAWWYALGATLGVLLILSLGCGLCVCMMYSFRTCLEQSQADRRRARNERRLSLLGSRADDDARAELLIRNLLENDGALVEHDEDEEMGAIAIVALEPCRAVDVRATTAFVKAPIARAAQSPGMMTLPRAAPSGAAVPAAAAGGASAGDQPAPVAVAVGGAALPASPAAVNDARIPVAAVAPGEVLDVDLLLEDERARRRRGI